MENSILRLFPAGKRSFWEKTVRNQQRLQEIRLRVDRPLILKLSGKEVFLTKEGNFTEDKEQAVRVPEEEMLEGIAGVRMEDMQRVVQTVLCEDAMTKGLVLPQE